MQWRAFTGLFRYFRLKIQSKTSNFLIRKLNGLQYTDVVSIMLEYDGGCLDLKYFNWCLQWWIVWLDFCTYEFTYDFKSGTGNFEGKNAVFEEKYAEKLVCIY